MGAVEGVSSGTLPGNTAAQDFVDTANLDAWPSDTSPLIDSGDPGLGVTMDFNWSTRDSAPDIGAYEWQAAGNPGWDVEPGFREGPRRRRAARSGRERARTGLRRARLRRCRRGRRGPGLRRGHRPRRRRRRLRLPHRPRR
ncbi:MAG: choice-of-anchor Q domain-containing protein [bacterium]